jgi:hypothetical protein
MSTSLPKPITQRRPAVHSIRPLVIASLSAALVVAAPAAAQAQSISNADTVGDVTRVTFHSAGADVSPAPQRALEDVTSTRLTHSATRVSVRVKFAELRRIGTGTSLSISVVTNEGIHRYLDVYSRPNDWSGMTEFYRRGGNRVRCGVRHSIDYNDNVIRASFPRRCASNPRWVRFTVMSWSVQRDEVSYLDDALRDRPVTLNDDGSTTDVRSRRVYRPAVS